MRFSVILLFIASSVVANPRVWIPEVVQHHYGRSIQGISVSVDHDGNEVFTWSAEETQPTSEELETWKAAWEVHRAQEIQTKQADDLGRDEVARWLELLTLKLIQKGVLVPSDVPQRVRDLISTRRTLRGDSE